MRAHSLIAVLMLVTFQLLSQSKYCNHTSASYSLTQPSTTLRNFDIKKVELDLRADNLSTQISGTATLTVEVIERSSKFQLELVDELSVSSAMINGVSVNVSHENDFLILNLSSPIDIGNTAIIKISYSGEPNPGDGIFSGINNAQSNTWNNQITWTLSEPFNAKSWWPAKQDLTDKIDQTVIKVTVPDHLMVGSNGLLTSIKQLGNSKTQYVWETNYPMAYYLLSMTIGQYVTYTTFANPTQLSNDSIMIQNFIYNNPATLAYFKDELDGIDEMLELFSELYGLYPFYEEKYGHIMAPFSGGMEHQTLSSMGFFSFGLNAHELAHQWYGNYTTCGRWNDIWINEGFARFSEYVAAEKLLSNKDAQAAIINDQLSVTGLDTGSVFIPLDQQLTDSRIFSFRLTYQKGGLILNTLRHVVNDDELFFSAMRDFSNQYANKTAIGEDFKNVLEAKTETDFDSFFEEWYYGEGHPKFDITYLLKDDSIYLDIHQQTTDNVSLFTTPLEFKITYESGNVKLFRISLLQNQESFTIPTFGNVKSVKFDPDNWLIKEVNSFSQIDEDGNVILNTPKNTEPSFYPNPANDQVNFSKSFKEISVFDMSGVELITKSYLQPRFSLDIKKLPSGLYLISTDGSSFKRLIVR